MAGLASSQTEAPLPPTPNQDEPGFTVTGQKIELEVDFRKKTLRGKTEIQVQPLKRSLRTIQLNFRHGKLTRLQVNGKPFSSKVADSYKFVGIPGNTDIRQWQMLRAKFEGQLSDSLENELTVTIPKNVSIDVLESNTPIQPIATLPVGRDDAFEDASQVALSTVPAVQYKYAPLTINAEFEIPNARDGIHFVGVDEGDGRYPHVYTTNQIFSPGTARSLFPCLDNMSSRCVFEVSIKSPRTLEDALQPAATNLNGNGVTQVAGVKRKHDEINTDLAAPRPKATVLSEEDKALEMIIMGPGNFVSEHADPADPNKKIAMFSCAESTSPLHIGFAVGPFETVSLAEWRDPDDEDKLGQNAIPIQAYCLPGRSEEVISTCMPMANAIDFFILNFRTYPFSEYKMCFVDDLISDDVEIVAASILSERLLFNKSILDPLLPSTRKLAHSLACQWSGISVGPKDLKDVWLVVGIAYFMADLFLQKLCGNNEYRFFQKSQAVRVCELDVNRPSLSDLGTSIEVDSSEFDLIAMKAPLVLFILDRRLARITGTSGLKSAISKIFLNAKMNESRSISTASFQRACEKMSFSAKLEVFFNQWVYGAGCPQFDVTQKFNKKRNQLEVLVKQRQARDVKPVVVGLDTFMRDYREAQAGIEAGGLQSVFQGTMTFRIHEADGTPYDFIDEINMLSKKADIPYNTKYKRLKRSRRNKERAAANATTTGPDLSGEGQDDVLLYCLGDTLQTEQDIADWRLADWTKEEEDRMAQESFEWLRLDADFEWICKMFAPMPDYMYVSQLQQDRDVVAQYEALNGLLSRPATHMLSTILVRTVMDRRYFYRVRVTAALGLARCATPELNWVGRFHLEKVFQELFCYPGSSTPRPNDFSDRSMYQLQCAIVQAMASIRGRDKNVPWPVKQWLLHKLKFNDNSRNEYSDAHYVSTLINAVCESLVDHRAADMAFDFDDDADDELAFRVEALEQVEKCQRIDLLEPSHHDIVTTTALACKSRLMKEKQIPLSMEEYVPYTQQFNSQFICLQAFKSLVDVFSLKHGALLRYFLHVLSSDPSPWLRYELQRVFERGLANIAIGEHKEIEASQQGLLVQDADLEARQANADRIKSIGAAVEALGAELLTALPARKMYDAEYVITRNTYGLFYYEPEHNLPLAQGLWSAVTSPHISFKDMQRLFDICQMLYAPQKKLPILLRYPRWPASPEHRGNGMIVIKFSSRIRDKPAPKRIKLTKQPSHLTAAHEDPALAGSRASPEVRPGTLKRPKKRAFGAVDDAKRNTPSPPPPPMESTNRNASGKATGNANGNAPGHKKLKLKLKFGGGGSPT